MLALARTIIQELRANGPETLISSRRLILEHKCSRIKK
jgi:hypothetical protein